MSDERRDAGPYDREIEAAMRWVWGTGTPPPPLADRDYACALAAVVEWYHRQRDVIAALDEWHARHLAWYEATDPHSVTPTRFDSAHYEMAAAWQRVVKALEARDRETPSRRAGGGGA